MNRKKLDVYDFLIYLKSLSDEEMSDLFWVLYIYFADKVAQEKREKIKKGDN